MNLMPTTFKGLTVWDGKPTKITPGSSSDVPAKTDKPPKPEKAPAQAKPKPNKVPKAKTPEQEAKTVT